MVNMMMDESPFPIATDVLKVTCLLSESPDHGLVGQEALNALFHTIFAEGAVFFLTGGKELFTNVMIKNPEEKYRDYHKTYFRQLDPLRLPQGMCNGKGLNHLEESACYDSFKSTDKKHFRNIYDKVGVNNRTSLVNRILDIAPTAPYLPSMTATFCA